MGTPVAADHEPWDEAPKRAALATAANKLLNAGLTGRPVRGVEDLLAPYADEGAEAVALANLRRGAEEGCRVAGRAVTVVRTPQGPVGVGGYYFSSAVHADGAGIPENHLVRPRVSASLALRVGRVIGHSDVTVAEILAAVDGVHAALVVGCRRVGEAGASTLLECIADNAHAGHVVLSDRWTAPAGADLGAEVLPLTVGAARSVHRLHPHASLHLVRALRRSIALAGPVQPGEVLVLPGSGAALDLGPGARATLRSSLGRLSVTHAAGAYDEGFEPLTHTRP